MSRLLPADPQSPPEAVPVEDSVTGLPPDAMGLELEEQAAVWSQLLERQGELADTVAPLLARRRPERVIFTGCGDCHAAAEYAEAVLGLRSGVEVRGLPPMELSRARDYLVDGETLLVALSVSGRTPRVLEAIRVALARGATCLALTDDPESPVATAAGTCFTLGTGPVEEVRRTDYQDPEAARYAGYHRAVPQTKSYGAMLLALALLSLELERLAPAPRGTPREELLQALRHLPGTALAARRCGEEAAVRLVAGLRRRGRLTFCGTGLHFSTARFAGYKLLELTCEGAHAEVEEFCHTQYLVTGLGDGAVFFAPNRDLLERVMEIVPVLEAEIGAVTAVLVPDPIGGVSSPCLFRLPGTCPEADPIVAAHVSGYIVRVLARSWGINTDRFRAGVDEEKYVRGSTRMIRESRILGV